MLRRERRVFFLIVGAALAIVWSVKAGNPVVAHLLHMPAVPQQVLNPALTPIPKVAPTPTPGDLADPVCAAYFRTSSSPDFIQGSWTDSAEATESLQACYDWMRRAILRKSGCAQAGAKAVIVVLVDESRHAFDLPDNLNMNSEFVVQQECP